MDKKKITLKFTQRQLDCLIDLMETIEVMIGSSDADDDENDFDINASINLINLKRILKSNKVI